MEDDLSLSLELGGGFTKRKREKISEEVIIDNRGKRGKETEIEKNLDLSFPLLLPEMENSKNCYVTSEVIIGFNFYGVTYDFFQ